MKKRHYVITYFVALFSVLALPSHAYLDPGSGSMLVQLLLAGGAGIAVLGKVYWNNLMMFFGCAKKVDAPNNEDDGAQ